MSVNTNLHVSFSQFNTFFPADSGAAPMNLLAPSDQLDESFDLEEFERTSPSPPQRSENVIQQVSDLIVKNRSYKSREQRVTRYARMKQRESSNLALAIKSQTSLLRVQQKKNAAKIADLIKKNNKFERHSEECKQVLVKWKEKEKGLKSKIAVKDHTITTLRTQIRDLTEQNAGLIKQQQDMREENKQVTAQAVEVSRERDQLLAQKHLVDAKERELNGIREVMHTQLEKIVQMGTSSE